MNNIPDQKPNEPHATFCNRVLSMARSSNNLALTPYGNLLNLWYVMGPIKVANPNYNSSADTEDENYEPEFLHVEECLNIIPHEGNKPVQNTLVTNKKFVQLLRIARVGGGDNGDFATVGASGRSRGRFLVTLEGRLPG